MSTREQRKRMRRLILAAVSHWSSAAKDVQDRVYASVRVEELSKSAGFIQTEEMNCGRCGHAVAIDERLLALAKAAKAIACTHCIEEVSGRPWQAIAMDALNENNGGLEL